MADDLGGGTRPPSQPEIDAAFDGAASSLQASRAEARKLENRLQSTTAVDFGSEVAGAEESSLDEAPASRESDHRGGQLRLVRDDGKLRNHVSPIMRFLYDVGSTLPNDIDYVYRRSWVYDTFDQSLNSAGSVYPSNFFHAASGVTGLRGLSGAQFWSIFPRGLSLSGHYRSPGYRDVGSEFGYDSQALANIRKLGRGLYRDVNVPLYRALYDGDDDFKLESGVRLGTVTRATQKDLDYALVHSEQTYVQRFLDRLPKKQRMSLIEQSNATLQMPGVPTHITKVLDELGHPFDFGSQSDREAIGRSAVMQPNPYAPVKRGWLW